MEKSTLKVSQPARFDEKSGGEAFCCAAAPGGSATERRPVRMPPAIQSAEKSNVDIVPSPLIDHSAQHGLLDLGRAHSPATARLHHWHDRAEGASARKTAQSIVAAARQFGSSEQYRACPRTLKAPLPLVPSLVSYLRAQRA